MFFYMNATQSNKKIVAFKCISMKCKALKKNFYYIDDLRQEDVILITVAISIYVERNVKFCYSTLFILGQ